MSGFSEAALEKKLIELNNSQQSIQTLSLWIIHHRKHHKLIVKVWLKALQNAKKNKKLTFIYLANDVIQNSRKKGPEYPKEFGHVLGKALQNISLVLTGSEEDTKTIGGIKRVLKVLEERNIYESNQIEKFRKAFNAKGSSTPKIATPTPQEKPIQEKPIKIRQKPSSSSKPLDEPLLKKRKIEAIFEEESDVLIGEPPEPEELIKALSDLENSASTDAVVREKIAKLSPEVSDPAVLENIKDKETAQCLAKKIEDALVLLSEYNTRLSQEQEDRKQVSRMLNDFSHHHKNQLSQSDKDIEEFREKYKKINVIRKELKQHLQKLPDLSLLPNVTQGLAPLPSAGDLFN